MKETYIEVAVPIPVHTLFQYKVPQSLVGEVKIGKRVEVLFSHRKVIGYIAGFSDKPVYAEIKDILNILDPYPVVTDENFKLAKWLSSYYLCSLGEALHTIVPNIKLTPVDVKEELPKDESFPAVDIDDDIREAVQAIKEKQHKVMLVMQPSGNLIEFYIRCALYTMSIGRSVLVIAPEIDTALKIFKQFEVKFDGKVNLWHSKLKDKERNKIWNAVYNEKSSIIVGTRSSMFLPVKNIGLIIIADEHDSAYRQDESPRYHVRDAAAMIGQIHNALLLLTSKTPSVESYHFAKTGKYKLLSSDEKLEKNNVHVVDICSENKKNRRFDIISDKLKEAVNDRFLKKEQTILFLNKKGYAKSIVCLECGNSLVCPNCNVSLVFDSDKNKLYCHYCSYQAGVTDECPKCKGHKVKFLGIGTQRLEGEIKKIFPDIKSARIEGDLSQQIYDELINKFNNRELDLIITTKPVMQDINQNNVTLIGVTSADINLYLPDFRAAENTFQLLSSIINIGCKDTVIQTCSPDHYSIEGAVSGDNNLFYDTELKMRMELGYPPFTYIAYVSFSGKDEKKVEEAVDKFTEEIKKSGYQIEVFDPALAAAGKLKGMIKWQVMLKAKELNLVQKAIVQTREKLKSSNTGRSVKITVDIL